MQNCKIKFKNNFFKHFGFLFAVLIFEFCFLHLPCFARDISFEVSVDKNKVSLGGSLHLNLSFHGSQNVSRPDLGDIEGFNWRYQGPSSRMSIVNGRASSSITHIYRLVPLKAGKFNIPSFSVKYKGETWQSKSIPIEIVEGVVLPKGEGREFSENKTGELEKRIFVNMELDKKKVYINELIPLTIKLYVNKLAVRDIQFPELTADGFSVDKFTKPRQYREILNEFAYDVIEFKTNVFPLRFGELSLGPAEIQCQLIVKKKMRKSSASIFDDDFFGADIFDDFFTRHKTYPLNLSSKKTMVKSLPLPEENVPADFNGALGDYTFYLEAHPKEVKVGDPITLKLIINGQGNFSTVKTFEFNFGGDFKIYEPEIKQERTGKLFEQVIIPKSDKVCEIPKINFSFFEPKTGEYKTIFRGPIPIKVNPLLEGEELKIFELPVEAEGPAGKKEILGKDIIYIKDSPGMLRKKNQFLCKNKLFIIFQLFPPLALLTLFISQKRKERLKNDIGYARRLCAPRKAKKNLLQLRSLLKSEEPDKFFDAVFSVLREYLGDKFHLPTAGITFNVIEEELKPRQVDQEILEKIEECFNNCDRARYAPTSVTSDEMRKSYELLREIIDTLERMKI